MREAGLGYGARGMTVSGSARAPFSSSKFCGQPIARARARADSLGCEGLQTRSRLLPFARLAAEARDVRRAANAGSVNRCAPWGVCRRELVDSKA